MTEDRAMNRLLEATRPLRARLAGHDVYGRLSSIDAVRTFMEHHVFAVWDFMTLLKALQRELTCTEALWLPTPDPVSRRLINEIVLDEESDEDGEGYISHFELYLDAMRQCGADDSRARDLIGRLSAGEGLSGALRACGAPAASRAFVESTWRTASSRSPHRIAAAFALGREEVIPEMFQEMICRIHRAFPDRFSRFADYLYRHFRMDAGVHGPMSARMVGRLCGDDEVRFAEALEAAEEALRARLALWDSVRDALAPEPVRN